MRVAALVPFKRLSGAKRRLRSRFPDAAVEELGRAMLADVLHALAGARSIERTWVLTDDPNVAEVAEAAGASVRLRVPDPGLNPAIAAATIEVAHEGFDASLVVLGDLPLLRPADIDAVIEAGADHPVVVVPSSDGGTALLLRQPPDRIPPRFGPESAERHVLEARAQGLDPIDVPAVGAPERIDLDTPEDAEKLLAAGRECRTVQVLRKLGAPRPGPAVPSELRLVALADIPEIQPGDDLGALLAARVPDGPGVLVVAQKVVSKAEGRLVALADVEPGERARALADEVDKDPRQVELVLRESVRIVRKAPGVLITETRHGLVCANSGVDLSNAPGTDVAILLPIDPDASARAIQRALGPGRGVVISDTFGRPWREGLVDTAIGVAGLAPLADFTGTADRAGRELQVTVMARADQLAAAAGVLMGKDAGRPAIWIEGIDPEGDGSLADLIRDPARDLFR